MKWISASKTCHINRNLVDFRAVGDIAERLNPYAALRRTRTRPRESSVVGSVSISLTVRGVGAPIGEVVGGEDMMADWVVK